MNIRKAEQKDFSRIIEIYSHARTFMAEHGNPRQWGITKWPPEELVKQDIEKGKSYVCENNDRIVAVFYYIQGKDIEPTYFKITDGNWKDSSAYGVIHRIATDHSTKGIGTFCINWAKQQCPHIRIDTHPDNTVMNNLLKKEGFEYRGIIYVEEDPDPRFAYEYIKQQKDQLNLKSTGK